MPNLTLLLSVEVVSSATPYLLVAHSHAPNQFSDSLHTGNWWDLPPSPSRSLYWSP